MRILYLHPKELTSPISIKDYINNCELCVGGEKKKIQKYPWNKPIIIRKDKNILLTKGEIKFTTDEWCLTCEDSTKNIIGKAIIVHQGTDDFTSQPSGAAGSRVSCGAIIE